MNYTKEYADINLSHGEAGENLAEEGRLYAERFLNQRTPSRHFEHQL
jgi:hypothetical protein